eukprot:4758428-Alexandrium_andersonii.AAC.1
MCIRDSGKGDKNTYGQTICFCWCVCAPGVGRARQPEAVSWRAGLRRSSSPCIAAVSYTHLRAHETSAHL